MLYPVAVETLGVLADEAHEFISEISRRASLSSATLVKRHSCTSGSLRQSSVSTQSACLTLSQFPSPHCSRSRHHKLCSMSHTLGMKYQGLKNNNNNNNNNKSITNSDLTDIQWIQTSLPVKDGGLGIRRVSSCLRSHFLPFWLQQQAHFISRRTSCQAVPVLIVSTCRPICQNGRRNLVQNYISPKHPFWDRRGVLVDQSR